MKINKISPMPFEAKYIKISLDNKRLTDGRLNPTSMDKVMGIAGHNKAPIVVNKDVFILSSSNKIKEELIKNNIEFQEIEDSQYYKSAQANFESDKKKEN